MVDGWMGDDWFHYGAFRQTNFDYTYLPDDQEGTKANRSREAPTTTMRLSVAPVRQATTRERTVSTNCRGLAKMMEHPAYDAFWQGQALDQLVAEHPSQVPDHVDSGSVGPGRHVGRDSLLSRAESQGSTPTITTWSWVRGGIAR